MTLAENLKYYREANGLTQEAVALELRISRQSVSKWENGESYPSIDNLIILRNIFNLSIDELIMGEKFLQLPFHVGNSTPARKQILRRPFLHPRDRINLSTLGSTKKQLWFLPPSHTFNSNLNRMRHILKKQEQQCLQPLNYSDITSITLSYEKKMRDPYTINLINYNLTPLMLLSMRDSFYFLVETIDGQRIQLDLTIDKFQKHTAYNYLTEICHFFEQRSIPVYDPFDILVAQQEQLNLYTFIYQGKCATTEKRTTIRSSFFLSSNNV